MAISLDLHNVTGITATPITRLINSHTGYYFYCRELLVTQDNGDVVKLPLYSSDGYSLLLPDEDPPADICPICRKAAATVALHDETYMASPTRVCPACLDLEAERYAERRSVA